MRREKPAWWLLRIASYAERTLQATRRTEYRP